VDGELNSSRNAFDIRFEASDEIFGKNSAGSPFNVYAPDKYLQMEKGVLIFKDLRTWAFAVKSPDHLSASWPLDEFENKKYHLCVYGPNGFFREFTGTADDPLVHISCGYERHSANKIQNTGNIEVMLTNYSGESYSVVITDNAYGAIPVKQVLSPGTANTDKQTIHLDLSRQFGWYDFTIKITSHPIFEKRYAGRVENGAAGFSDPFMGHVNG
jgi:phospholipase C